MKKFICVLLSLIMILSLAPASVFATSTGTSESYALSITNKPGTTFELSRGEYTYDVCDLWNEIDSDGTGELKFDQSFSININNAVDAYNNYNYAHLRRVTVSFFVFYTKLPYLYSRND